MPAYHTSVSCYIACQKLSLDTHSRRLGYIAFHFCTSDSRTYETWSIHAYGIIVMYKLNRILPARQCVRYTLQDNPSTSLSELLCCYLCIRAVDCLVLLDVAISVCGLLVFVLLVPRLAHV